MTKTQGDNQAHLMTMFLSERDRCVLEVKLMLRYTCTIVCVRTK